MCIGCRRRRTSDSMIRVVARHGGLAVGRELEGRGAWLCPTEACFEQASKRKAWARALRLEVDRDAVAALRSHLESGCALPLGC